ncbi:MAG: hypothetical protein NC548_31525 [Lachnospiraceae bacterium]|nr:hypothetical protein [Lachnospiraceae bacterium]
MIMLTTPIRLYGRKVVTDLALRSGLATANDFSPYEGKNGIVAHFVKAETLANIEYLFENQSDYDADIKQPHYDSEHYNKIQESEEYERGIDYSPAKDKLDFNDYHRRLEVIAVEYLEEYISNLCFGIANRSGSNGIITFNNEHRIQPTLISVDDDDVTELADLQLRVDATEWSNEARASARDNLPYVLKRLHNLSRLCGIHMLSMIGAYLRAKEYNDRLLQTGQSKSTLKKNAVINEGVYKCDADGNIGSQIEVSNKSKKAADMFDWIIGANNMYSSYRDDLVNFLQYCKILNIDLINDDLRKYDNDFIDNLTVLTLTPDTQYCQAVFDAIRDSGLVIPSTDAEDICLTTMNCFRDICDTNATLIGVIAAHDSIKAEQYLKKARTLHYVWSLRCCDPPTMPNDRLYQWQNGFLYYNGELAVLDTHLISKQSFSRPKFLISELGYCIHVGDTMYLEVMTVDCAYANMENTYLKPDIDYEPNNWVWFQ